MAKQRELCEETQSFKKESLLMAKNAYNMIERIKQNIRDDFRKPIEDRILTGEQNDYESCFYMDLDKFRQLLDVDESRMKAKLDKAEDQVKGT